VNTLTIAAKGRIAMPKDLLTHLGVNPGERMAVDKR